MQGRIAQVVVQEVGSALAGDHLAGDTVISVSDAADFSDYGNDEVEIDGIVYTTLERVDATLPEDDENDALVLATPLVADVESGTHVYLLPKAEEKIATVYIEDDEDEAIEAVVPYEMTTMLDDGIREPEDQESVEVDINEDGEWEITAIGGQTPRIGSDYLDMPDVGSDGEPPEGSPATTVVPLYATLIAKWAPQPNADQVGYNVWLSAPDIPATHIETVYGTSVQIASEPSGALLRKDVEYTVWVHAFDVDGLAPTVGQTGTGQIVALTREDLEQQVLDAIDAATTTSTAAQQAANDASSEASAATAAAAQAAADALAAAQAASAAQGDADAAQTAAGAAQTAAGTAQSTADAAATAASEAQADADAAATAAADKGKLIVQVSAPTGANADPKNLWIDISLLGGVPRNQPKRYNTSTGQWEAITDKVALDAAAQALTAFNNAATAQSRADEAFTAATNAATVAGQAQTAANGKNRVWYLPNQPPAGGHVVNDVWFDTSVDATTGEVKNLPHKWDGDSWEPQPFGNAAIGNLDAAKITAGFLDVANRIEAGSMGVDKLDVEVIVAGEVYAQEGYVGKLGADQISSGLLDATLGILQALEVGPYITINPQDGIVIELADGEIRFPADGSPAVVTAGINAKWIVIEDNLSIRGSGTLQGELSLANGITKPTVAPSVSARYKNVPVPAYSGDMIPQMMGMTEHDANQYMTLGNFFGPVLRFVNKDTWSSGYDLTLGQTWGANTFMQSICKVGGYFYLIGQDHDRPSSGTYFGKWYIYKINATTGAKVSEKLLGEQGMFGGFKPALVAIDNHVGMIWHSSNNNINLRRYIASSLDQTGTDQVLMTTGARYDVLDAHYGPHGAGGAKRLYVSSAGMASILVFSAPISDYLPYSGIGTVTWSAVPGATGYEFIISESGYPDAAGGTSSGTTSRVIAAYESFGSLVARFNTTRIVAEEFPRANNALAQALSFDSRAETGEGETSKGNRFHSFAPNNTMYEYGRNISAETVRASYAWYDGTGTTHRTEASPEATHYRQARAGFQIETPAAPEVANQDPANPDKANQILLYAAVGTTPRLQSTLAIGKRSETYWNTVPHTGATPSTENEFASAGVTPGILQSTAQDGKGRIIKLSGDGSGRLGPFSWGTDGRTLRDSGPERPGTIIMWSSPSIPLDCALANGQAVPRPKTNGYNGALGNPSSTDDTYQQLFTLYGTTYGAGDGSTTFNLPDYRDRILVGIGTYATSILSNDGVAYGGRSLAHKHNHIMPDHTHGSGTYETASARSSGVQVSPGTANGNTPRWDTFNNHTHNVTGNSGIVIGANPQKATENQPKTGTDAIPFHGVYVLVKL